MTIATSHVARRVPQGALRTLALTVALAAAPFLAGCNNAGEGAVSGAGLGALGGLAIGSVFGAAGKGAIIGAAGGALIGGVAGDQNQRNRQNSNYR
ncbi:MAG: glycine zipper family protein [Phycisphaerales bacterium]